MMRLLSVTVLLVVVGLAVSAQAESPTSKQHQPYLVGVFGQPPRTAEISDNFGHWKSIGVDVLVNYDQGPQKNISVEEWDAAALAKGLKIIRQPSWNNTRRDDTFEEMPQEDVQYDLSQPHLIAWAHPDEPDTDAANKNDWSDKTLEPMRVRYRKLKEVAPHKPVYANFMGSSMNNTPQIKWHGRAAEYADLLAYDFYPINRVYSIDLCLNEIYDRFTDAWGTDKPMYVYIETSDQNLRDAPAFRGPKHEPKTRLMRAPTPHELRCQMALSAAKGAAGIIFFPQRVAGGFRYDATPPENLAVLREEIPQWKGLTTDIGHEIDVADELVGRERPWNNQIARIIVNPTDETVKDKDGTVYKPFQYRMIVLDPHSLRDDAQDRELAAVRKDLDQQKQQLHRLTADVDQILGR